jgi:transcriptional regulator with XRE-family HTH domain
MICQKIAMSEETGSIELGHAIEYWRKFLGMTQGQFAERVGVGQGFMSDIINAKKFPRYDKVEQFAAAAGVTVPEFFSVPTGGKTGDYSLVPMVKAQPSMGNGSLETDGEYKGWYSFKTDFLRRKGTPERMRLFRVKGDSMEPTLRTGDVVLVDQSSASPESGKIFLVTIEEELFLKRIEKIPGAVLLRSDNRDVHPDPIRIDRENEENVKIHGKMVWSCREY